MSRSAQRIGVCTNFCRAPGAGCLQLWVNVCSLRRGRVSAIGGCIPMDSQAKTESFLQKRITSIDALRGFDMFWITGGEGIIHALHRVAPGPTTEALDMQFRHVSWAGFHFYDLIFPLFLFVVGAVLPFSLTRRLEAGANRGHSFTATSSVAWWCSSCWA